MKCTEHIELWTSVWWVVVVPCLCCERLSLVTCKYYYINWMTRPKQAFPQDIVRSPHWWDYSVIIMHLWIMWIWSRSNLSNLCFCWDVFASLCKCMMLFTEPVNLLCWTLDLMKDLQSMTWFSCLQIYEDLNSGKPSLKLLYVTPELIATSGFSAKLSKIHVRGLLHLIAIDEVCCFSCANEGNA